MERMNDPNTKQFSDLLQSLISSQVSQVSLESFGLSIHETGPTHVQGGTLDIVITRNAARNIIPDITRHSQRYTTLRKLSHLLEFYPS